MSRLTAVERYLAAQISEDHRDGAPSPSPVRPFITISRQAGAGGHQLAEALLESFAEEADRQLFGGWQVFDRRLCELVAETPAYSRSMSALVDEEYHTRTDEFFRRILSPTADQDQMMLHVFEVVRAVASVGKSIIVGRAGSEVTREMAAGISIRLVAPQEVRIKGVMDYYELGERAAKDKAAKLDASRARLLKSHFGVEIDDPTRYDAVWNTGQVPIELIAESVTLLVRRMVVADLVDTS
jgi:cytidylate kinase